jgi:hypothetical protein
MLVTVAAEGAKTVLSADAKAEASEAGTLVSASYSISPLACVMRVDEILHPEAARTRKANAQTRLEAPTKAAASAPTISVQQAAAVDEAPASAARRSSRPRRPALPTLATADPNGGLDADEALRLALLLSSTDAVNAFNVVAPKSTEAVSDPVLPARKPQTNAAVEKKPNGIAGSSRRGKKSETVASPDSDCDSSCVSHGEHQAEELDLEESYPSPPAKYVSFIIALNLGGDAENIQPQHRYILHVPDALAGEVDRVCRLTRRRPVFGTETGCMIWEKSADCNIANLALARMIRALTFTGVLASFDGGK